MTSIEAQVLQPYKYGFETLIESEIVPPGLNEDVVRVISAKKGQALQLSPKKGGLARRSPTRG